MKITIGLYIFKNKKVRIVGLIVSILLIIVTTLYTLTNKTVYSTQILLSGNTYIFDDTCSVKIKDESIGSLSIRYEENIEDYLVHADFIKEGKTEFTLECPGVYKKTFDISVKLNTYDLKEREE